MASVHVRAQWKPHAGPQQEHVRSPHGSLLLFPFNSGHCGVRACVTPVPGFRTSGPENLVLPLLCVPTDDYTERVLFLFIPK